MICFLDMDGVLCDFHGAILKYHNKSDPYYNPDNLGKYGLHTLLGMRYMDMMSPLTTEFWENLSPTPWMQDLVSLSKKLYDTYILTAPAANDACLAGKRVWIRKYLPYFNERFLIGTCKHACASKNNILVDDKTSNIDKFIQYGGHGVLVPQPWNCLYERNVWESISGRLNQIHSPKNRWSNE